MTGFQSTLGCGSSKGKIWKKKEKRCQRIETVLKGCDFSCNPVNEDEGMCKLVTSNNNNTQHTIQNVQKERPFPKNFQPGMITYIHDML